MIAKLNDIKNSKHPYSSEINRVSALLDKIFNGLLIVLNAIYCIAAIITLTDLAEWAVEYMFLHTIIVFALISAVLFCVKTVTITLLQVKARMLDSLYHNEKLTELLVEKSCNSQDDATASQTTSA